MEDYKKILKLIECVDPKDNEALDEIDDKIAYLLGWEKHYIEYESSMAFSGSYFSRGTECYHSEVPYWTPPTLKEDWIEANTEEDGTYPEFDKQEALYQYEEGLGYGCDGWRPLYTRSRDALKSIRPDGWFSVDENAAKGWQASINQPDTTEQYFYITRLPTEELAELHIIIQAKAHERKE